MKYKIRIIAAVLLLLTTAAFAQQAKNIHLLAGEQWYGAAVNESAKMPFKTGYSLDLNNNVSGNQAAPLLLSNKGRYIWSDAPFSFTLNADNITVEKTTGLITVQQAGATLADAYNAASKKYFPASGKMPDELLFARPQYNTWIELIYNQNQKDILQYAHDIINNGFEPGVLMIDDNWVPYYGRFEFRKDRFPDAKAMMDELHKMGFKVMLWICPFIRPDSEEARFLLTKKWVMMAPENNTTTWAQSTEAAIIHWWNGYSMVMDFTQSGAVNWYQQQLDKMVQTYGVDGYKLDAGDPEYYAGKLSFKPITANEHTELWGNFGLQYPLNEYRAMWKMGGQPLAERLRDKNHTWPDLQRLVSGITTAGLLGYAFTCPDMIGGGDYSSFIDVDAKKLDQDLVVRSAQCHALMPMMQFSVAPWRILDEAHFNAVKKAVALRKKYTPTILTLARLAANNGQPVVRHMEYVFPNQGFAACNDQFMLGDKILVAPVTTKTNQRTVQLPKGEWLSYDGKKMMGGKTYSIHVAIEDLPFYTLIKK